MGAAAARVVAKAKRAAGEPDSRGNVLSRFDVSYTNDVTAPCGSVMDTRLQNTGA
jgi:hypothetical protein